MTRTVRSILNEANVRIAKAGMTNTATLDAQVLLAHILQVNRSHFYADPDRELNADEISAYENLVARRCQGEPIAYLIEHKEFWSREFMVNEHVLIPRPETELIVEWCLNEDNLPAQSPLRVVDLGSGSGVLAVTLALERPTWQISAIDKSAEALAVAQRNAAALGASAVRWLCGDWLAPVALEGFEVVVSNPPYVEGTDPWLREGGVRYEPQMAIVAAEHGLAHVRVITEQAIQVLVQGGVLVMEHGYDQQAQVIGLCEQAGFVDVHGFKDYAGLPRMVVARKS